ncbi:hypothetical protein Pfo_024731 [Paulownia fortunei]|nr:hypothetical protein Pfo_024731 [Paulownia fortunei]
MASDSTVPAQETHEEDYSNIFPDDDFVSESGVSAYKILLPTGCHSTVPADYKEITRNNFPDDFVFGSGTAAYQNEGGAAKGGRGLSVWDVFTLRTPGRITDGSNGNVAVDMYTRYKEDIKMMKSMGFDAYRFSISWPRILPGGKLCLGVNQEGIDFYNDLINTLIAYEIKPYVTLFHWDLPYSLEQEYGGFLSKNIVDDFRDFAELCFWEFGDRVKYWITLNEPWTYSVQGYVARIFPPGKKASGSGVSAVTSSGSARISGLTSNLVDKVADNLISHKATNKIGHNFIPYRGFNGVESDDLSFNTYSAVHDQTISIPSNISDVFNKLICPPSDKRTSHGTHSTSDQAKEAYTVARNLLLAHAAAVQAYRKRFQQHQKGKIGITLVSHWFEPLNVKVKDKKAAKRALDFMLGWFLEPVLSGHYPKNMTGYVPHENLEPFSKEESDLLKGSIDFLGLNYYTAWYATDDPHPKAEEGYYKDQQVKFLTEKNDKPIGESTGSWWLYIVPWGIHKLLKYINNTYNNCRYNLPDIYITENGVDEQNNHKLTAYEACRDERRVNYFRDHLGNILKAINENVKVKGYFAWSWSDNFEWRDGYTVRFGLIYIDYMNHLRRHPKDSAMWFSKFLLKNKAPGTNKSHVKQGTENKH